MSLAKFKSISLFAWYAPAETKVPASALAAAILPGSGDIEKVLCRYLGVNRCITGNSGRFLLCGLLETLWNKNERKRDEVLIPGYTCYSVAASVAKAGLKIRVYDLDPGTLNPSMDSLKNSVNEKTCAIVGQHLFGIPASLDGLKDLADEKGICFIEDAAQALGGKGEHGFLGTFADFGLYSFGRGKALPLGEGGALIGRDSAGLKKLYITRESSGCKSVLEAAGVQILSHPFIYWLVEALPLGLGETIFDTDIQNASMSVSMKKVASKALAVLHSLNDHRNNIARVYMEILGEHHTIPLPDDVSPVFTRFPVKAGTRTISPVLRRLGVRRMYPKAIQDEVSIRPYFAEHQLPTPGSSHIAESLITLPTHLRITNDLAREIAQEVKEYYQW